MCLAALCVQPGCFLLGPNRGISKPPSDYAEVRKWWEETIKRVDAPTLRCWLQASEQHRERGSSATYLSSRYLGHSMIGPYYHEQHYPTPIPLDLLPLVETRLAREKTDAEAMADLVSVLQCERCTTVEAWEMWKRQYK